MFNYLVTLPFFVLIGLGPLPFTILGLLIDHIFTLALSFSIIVSACAYPLRFTSLSIAVLIYLLSLVPSVIHAGDLEHSFSRFLITCGYGVTVAILFCRPRQIVRFEYIVRLAQVALLFSSVIILFFYVLSVFSLNERFSIGAGLELALGYVDFKVDPNTTSMGLVLLFSLCVPYLTRANNNFLKSAGLCLLITLSIIAIVSLASRTAIIAMLILAIIVFLNRQSSASKLSDKFLFGFVFFVVFFLADYVSLANRFDLNVMQHEANLDTGRFSLIRVAIDEYNQSLWNYLFGMGYAHTNPHNEYLRNFFDSGVFVGFYNVFLLAFVYFSSRKKSICNVGNPYFVDAVALPFFFMLLTYGHTKIYWVGLAFIWLVSCTQRQRVQFKID